MLSKVALQNRKGNTFPDKQTLKVFITTRLALQETLKGILSAEMKLAGIGKYTIKFGILQCCKSGWKIAYDSSVKVKR